MKTIIVNKIPGKLPQLWQREVVFFANILALFYGNEMQTDVLRNEIGTLETYGNRLLPILNLLFRGDNNLLILERKPDASLLSYFKDDLGLCLPEIKVLTHRDYMSAQKEEQEYNQGFVSFLKSVRQHSSDWIDGYVSDPILERFGVLTKKKMITSPEGSRRGNNKYLLYEHIREKGLPVFDTYAAQTRNEVQKALKGLEEKGYQLAVVKSQVGASGIGMQKIRVKETTENLPEYLFFEGPCLVQGWLDGSFAHMRYVGSPSVQMFLDDECVNLYDLTEQFLSYESVHEGNVVPARFLIDDKNTVDEILRQAEVAGRWLHGQGYRGTASGDFHIMEEAGLRTVRLCEINARVTGATYPSLLSRYLLPKGAWLMRNIRFAPVVRNTFLLETLDKQKLLFQRGRKEGILPFNLNFDQEGDIVKGQFLFIGETLERVCSLLDELVRISSIHCSYDRD